MSKAEHERVLIEVFHAESLAHGAANVARQTRMLGLIAVGFAGLAGLASLLLADDRAEVYFVAPFVILILWMSCVRILAELTMASAFQAYYDEQLSRLLDTKDYRFRSWQSSASTRGLRSLANWTIFLFTAVVSLAAIGWCSFQTILLAGQSVGVGLAIFWAVSASLIVVSALRLWPLRRRVLADLGYRQPTP